MTDNNIQTYLNRAYALKCDIDRKHQQIEALQVLAERATGTWQAVRVSGTQSCSKLENAVVKIADIGERLAQDMAAFRAAYEEIAAVIEAVENTTHRQLLSLRYLSFKRWWEVAEAMGKSEYHITHRLHPQALQSAAEKKEKAGG